MTLSSNNVVFMKHYNIFIADGVNIIEPILLYILYIEWYSPKNSAFNRQFLPDAYNFCLNFCLYASSRVLHTNLYLSARHIFFT